MEYTKRHSRSTVFRIVPKFKKEKAQKHKTSPQPGMCSPVKILIGMFIMMLPSGKSFQTDTFSSLYKATLQTEF